MEGIYHVEHRGSQGEGAVCVWTWMMVCMVPVLDSELHQCFQSILQGSVRYRDFKEKCSLQESV